MNKKYEGHSPAPWAWGERDRGLFDASADEESMVLRHEPYEGMWLGYVNGREANRLLIQDSPTLARQNAELRRALAELEAAWAAIAVDTNKSTWENYPNRQAGLVSRRVCGALEYREIVAAGVAALETLTNCPEL